MIELLSVVETGAGMFVGSSVVEFSSSSDETVESWTRDSSSSDCPAPMERFGSVTTFVDNDRFFLGGMTVVE